MKKRWIIALTVLFACPLLYLLMPVAILALIAGIVLAARHKIAWKSLGLALLATPLAYVASYAFWLSAYLLVVVLVPGIAALADTLRSDDRSPELRSHLTIYVAPPLLTEGGAVIVAAIPIPETEWRALEGENLAEDDPNNRQRPTLASTDRLFGVRATSTATIIEMFYPENGTFGFDLVPAPDIARPPRLETELVLVGDGGWTDLKKGISYKWPDVSTIYVSGPANGEDFARLIRTSQVDLMRQYPDESYYEGANVYSPTIEQIEKASGPGSLP